MNKRNYFLFIHIALPMCLIKAQAAELKPFTMNSFPDGKIDHKTYGWRVVQVGEQ